MPEASRTSERSCRRASGQFQNGSSACSVPVGETEGSAQLFCDSAANSEPQSTPFFLSGVKGRKEPFRISRSQAAPFIFNDDACPNLFHDRRPRAEERFSADGGLSGERDTLDSEPPSRFAGINRVDEQIQEDLLHISWVRSDQGDFGTPIDRRFDGSAAEPIAQQPYDFQGDFSQTDVRWRRGPGRRPSVVKNLVHNRAASLGLVVNPLTDLAPRVCPLLLDQDMGESEDNRHRVSHLVDESCGEFAKAGQPLVGDEAPLETLLNRGFREQKHGPCGPSLRIPKRAASEPEEERRPVGSAPAAHGLFPTSFGAAQDERRVVCFRATEGLLPGDPENVLGVPSRDDLSRASKSRDSFVQIRQQNPLSHSFKEGR